MVSAFRESPIERITEVGWPSGIEIPYLIRLEVSSVKTTSLGSPWYYDEQYWIFHLGLTPPTETVHVARYHYLRSNGSPGGFLEWADGIDYGSVAATFSSTLSGFSFTTYTDTEPLTEEANRYLFQDPDFGNRVIGVRHGVYNFSSGDGAGPSREVAFSGYLGDASPGYSAMGGAPSPVIGGVQGGDGTHTYAWDEQYVTVT